LIFTESTVKDLYSQIEMMKQQILTVQQSGLINPNPISNNETFSNI